MAPKSFFLNFVNFGAYNASGFYISIKSGIYFILSDYLPEIKTDIFTSIIGGYHTKF